MPNLTLPEIIQAMSKMYDVQIVPKVEKSVDFFDFLDHMNLLAERFGLRGSYKGAGHSANWERAAKESGDFRDNKYHSYWVHFDNDLDATRFMHRMNSDPTLMYVATPPQEPLGFQSLKLVKRIP